MSLTHRVADMIAVAGSATIDELHPQLPEYTRKQVYEAIKNANRIGLCYCLGRVPRVKGRGGSQPARWYPGRKPPGAKALPVPQPLPKSSIFDTGEPRYTVLPLEGEGRKFNPLGEWEEA